MRFAIFGDSHFFLYLQALRVIERFLSQLKLKIATTSPKMKALDDL